MYFKRAMSIMISIYIIYIHVYLWLACQYVVPVWFKQYTSVDTNNIIIVACILWLNN